jgi:hypothetical protein
MMDRTDRQKVIDGALGSLGLFLIVLTGWAVERQQSGTRAGGLLARFVLAGVATIGWTMDRLPLPAKRGNGHGAGNFARPAIQAGTSHGQS